MNVKLKIRKLKLEIKDAEKKHEELMENTNNRILELEFEKTDLHNRLKEKDMVLIKLKKK